MAHINHLVVGAGMGTRTPLIGLEGRDNNQLYDTRSQVQSYFIELKTKVQ